MKHIALWTAGMLFASWSAAAPAAVRAVACDGCDAEREQHKALSYEGYGFLFVYNVADRRLRKFEIVAAGTNARPKANRIATSADAVGEQSKPGAASRELWEHPADEGVRRIFDAIVEAESRAPGTLAGRRALELPIAAIGTMPDVDPPRTFDPRDVAWFSGTPRGATHNHFEARLKERLADATATGRMSADLARIVHRIKVPSRTVPVAVGVAAPSVGVAWEGVLPSVDLKLCDDARNCVSIVATIDGDAVRIVYGETRDRHNLTLPNAEQARRVDLEWPHDGRDGAVAYAQWLRTEKHASVDDGIGDKAECQSYVLTCDRRDGRPSLTCRAHCR